MSNKKVVLKIDNYEFTVNLELLILNSLYFRAMFSGSYQESNKKIIEIQNIKSTAFKLILRKLENDNENIGDHEIIDVLKAAYLLQIDSISKICLSRLEHLVSDLKYCLEIWKVSLDLFVPKLTKLAKYIAVIEFDDIRNRQEIYYLEFWLFFEYVSCSTLFVKNEFHVFEVILQWWNYNKHLQKKFIEIDHKAYSTLFVLLTCLDFNEIETVEVERMINLLDDNENQIIIQILECLISQRNDCYYSKYTKYVTDNVMILKNCGRRTILEVPCAICLTYDNCVMNTSMCYYDENFKEMKLINYAPVLENLEGYSLVSYKNWIYIFGGQDTSGRLKQWNNSSFWKFDVITNQFIRLKRYELNTRDAKAILVDSKIYLTNSDEIKRKIFCYEIDTDNWSEMNTFSKSIKDPVFCQLNNKLLALSRNLSSKLVGQIFSADLSNWININLVDDKNLIAKNTVIDFVFSNKRNLYIKTSSCVLTAKIDNLYNLEVIDCFYVLSKSTTNNAICGTMNRKLYSFHKHQYFLFTEELYLYLIDIDRKLGEQIDCIKINNYSKHVEWNLSVGTFSIFHIDLISKANSISSLMFEE